ncbi:PAS domain S-box protein [Cytobacillus sp. FJAT-53684]|uniref:histidine kinase n=1 Tax=Cytobacillus mangrovibacter TaxID=3299024 RepID=A0ABW6JZ51_9BACI
MLKKKLSILLIISGIIWIIGTTYFLSQYTPSPMILHLKWIIELSYILTIGWLFYSFISQARALNKSKEAEERLYTLIHSMVDCVIFKDGEGKWLEANTFGLKLFQLEHVDFKGKKDSELAEFSHFYKETLNYCEVSDEETWLNGGITHVEEVVPMPDGSSKTFDTIKVPLFHSDNSRKGLVIIGRDITERKHTEDLLNISIQKYRSLFEYNPEIVYMTDLSGVITKVNPQLQLVTGYSAKQAVGKNIANFVPKHVKMIVEHSISNIINGQTSQSYEMEVNHKKGNTITLQCTSLPIIVNNQIEGIISYAKDVTLLRQTEERLRRTEKLSIVGELAASVAHEIRNPLTSLIGFVQLLQMESEKHQFYHKIMLEELNRINHITGELLLLAKPQQVVFKKINLYKIVFDVISLLQPDANSQNVQLKFLSMLQEYWMDGEPNQLKQLFINIIKNAIDASGNNGEVTVYLDSKLDGQISISVKDQGCGISEKRLEKIGEPFYSSKDKGTGLGLTVSFKIVQSHSGSIEFKSEINKGTEVLILLPITNKESPELAREEIGFS